MRKIYTEVIDYFDGQANTAAKLQVSQPTVSGWFNGKHGMSAKTALRVERLSFGKFKACDLSDDLAEELCASINLSNLAN